MLILDSNLWIHGVTFEGGRSDEYIEKLLAHRAKATLNAYIVCEVIENIYSDTSVSQKARDAAVERFSRMISACPSITNPTQGEVREMDRRVHRKKDYNQLIGALGDIQPKDAPILILAYHYLDSQPTILTDDEEFSEFDPEKYGISNLSVERVPLEWDALDQKAAEIEYTSTDDT